MSSQIAQSYWDFIDETIDSNATVLRIASTGFDGDAMVSELKANPIIDFGAFTIDFNANQWNFFVDKGSPVYNASMASAQFSDVEGDNVWKLFLLCQLVWKKNKTHVCGKNLYETRKAFADCGGTDARTSVITLERYMEYIGLLSAKTASTRHNRSMCLLEFLRFRQTFFGVPLDEDLEKQMEHVIKESGRIMWSEDRTPAIDDTYLEPLVETCRNALRSDDENLRQKTAAATILLASQIGMRISEAVAIEAGALHISRLEGKPDIAYLEFRTFKGAKGDGNYRVARTIINPIALEAYMWLDENCRKWREKKGIETLIVTPKQKRRYLGREMMSTMVWEFVLKHHDTIPCIDTQDIYPEMNARPVREFIKKREPVSVRKPEDVGLTGEEMLVVPKFHSFRATVATKLYESGVDMRYIRKHMSHISEDTTAGYIRSDREIEKANSDLVYKSILADGAQLIGQYGDDFVAKVNQYIETLPDKVKADMDEVIASASKAYPLRRKVGGVCIRCGKFVPCKRNNETDQIYCAFGVCPNQCVLYFMASDCLDMVRSHMELVDVNIERGHTKSARNELRKAQNVIRDALMPEIESLEQQLGTHGRDGVIARFPDLEELIDNLDEVKEEVTEWLTRKI